MKSKEKTIKVDLSLSELEDIIHHFQMESCDWVIKSHKEARTGKNHEAEVSERVSEDYWKGYNKFKRIKAELLKKIGEEK